jgi:hypothetical protein
MEVENESFQDKIIAISIKDGDDWIKIIDKINMLQEKRKA